MRRQWLKLAAVPIALTLVAAACGSDDNSSSSDTTANTEATTDTGATDTAATGDAGDFGGATVTITGPERDDPSDRRHPGHAVTRSATPSTSRSSTRATPTGKRTSPPRSKAATRRASASSRSPACSRTSPPPVSIVPLSDEVDATVDEYWGDDYQVYGQYDGTQYGVPVKTDLKSLVWYVPSAFEAAGLRSADDVRRVHRARRPDHGRRQRRRRSASASSPVGATGWPFTDWVEDMVLRQDGGDVYDQWVNHEIPFNDPQIVEAMQTVIDLWSDDNVYALGWLDRRHRLPGQRPAAARRRLLHAPSGELLPGHVPRGHRRSPIGSDGSVDVFYFPDINGDKPVLTAGTFAAAFNDDPATMAVLNYMATGDYASARQKAQTAELGGGLSGFLSAAKNQDPSVYQPLEQGFLEILECSQLSRFDGSDQMPADVGYGTFWTEGTSLVNGDETAPASGRQHRGLLADLTIV